MLQVVVRVVSHFLSSSYFIEKCTLVRDSEVSSPPSITVVDTSHYAYTYYFCDATAQLVSRPPHY
jgi:hypothetical protein